MQSTRKYPNTKLPKMKKKKKKHPLRLGFFCLFIMGIFLFQAGFFPLSFSQMQEELRWQSASLYASIFSTATPSLDPKTVDKILCKNKETDTMYKTIYEHKAEYPDELLASLCLNEELLDYTYHFNDSHSKKSVTLTEDEANADIPLFLQWDPRWGYQEYGEGYIGYSGCAPTCLAMIATGLSHRTDTTPDQIAQYATQKHYYHPGTGTRWVFLTEGAEAFGLRGKEICLDKQIIFQHLKNNEPIICSVGPGDFTSKGHFIVLRGISDGKLIINDPNSVERSNILWDYDRISGQIKNLWAYEAI